MLEAIDRYDYDKTDLASVRTFQYSAHDDLQATRSCLKNEIEEIDRNIQKNQSKIEQD